MTIRRVKGKGWDSINPGIGKKPRIDDLVDLLQYPSGEWTDIRFIGDVHNYAFHWIEITTKRKKKTQFPKICLAWDRETESMDSTIDCPYCALSNQRFGLSYYSNAIVREDQDAEPKKKPKPTRTEVKTGFKEKDSSTWTPVKVVRLTTSLARKILSRQKLNRIKTKSGVKVMPISHPKYGCDMSIRFDPDATGTEMYDAQKGDRSPLQEDELEYLIWDISNLLEPEPLKEAKEEVRRLKKNNPGMKDTSEDEDYEDDDELDFEDKDTDDEEDDEKEKQKKRKRKPAPKDKDDELDDEDDELDDDILDEDEEESDEDDEDVDDLFDDEDEDESEDEDEEEDEPKRRRNKPSKKRSKKVKDDDDDLDLFDDEIDDEDEDEPEDEEEEEPEPPKKVRTRTKKKASRRRR